MWPLVLRHELLRRLPKLAGLVLGLAGIAMALVTRFSGPTENGQWLSPGALGLFQVLVFLSACSVLALPEAGRRCRAWELGLPLPGRGLWGSHRISLLLAGLLLMVLYAPVPLLAWKIFAGMDEALVLLPDSGLSLARFCLDTWGLPVLCWVLMVDRTTSWWPAMAWPVDSPSYKVRLVVLAGGLSAVLWLVSRSGLDSLLLWTPLLFLVTHWRLKIPEGLLLPGGRDAKPQTEDPSTLAHGNWEVVSSGTWIMHRLLLRTLFKFPMHWIMMPLLGLTFGFFLSGTGPFGDDSALLRFGHVFMVAYMLIAGVGFLLEHLHKVDHLPVSRTVILGWLIWPMVLSITLGNAIGHQLARRPGPPVERISFHNDDEGYGLKVPGRVFNVVRGPAPDINAPWGESHPAESYPVLTGLPWTIYKPFSTPKDASLRFTQWQLERAVLAVYGETWQADGLFHLEDGRPQVGPEGLNLAEAHPDWKTRPIGPLFPFQMGGILFLFFLGLIFIFGMLRRQATLLRTRIVFWAVMVFYLGLHLVGFAQLMAGRTHEWIIQGLILGVLGKPEALSSGFAVASWGGLVVLTVLGWSLASRIFGRLEATR